MLRFLPWITLTAIVPLALASQEPAISVPAVRGRPIVLDGRIEPGEWGEAVNVTTLEGITTRLLHDGRYLYVAFQGDRFGFNSLCSARGDTVRILHASAALGAVTYTRGPAGWSSRDTAFTYGMRDTSMTDAARSERDTYLGTHGWVANTVNMGAGLGQEFRIALSSLANPPRIAVARFVPLRGGTPDIHRWPTSVDASDGCLAPRLVSGYVPSPLTFDPARWATLALRR